VSLTAGTQLGPYEILAPLGAGGMGEVYRAKDTRLGRTVAIKVLPAHLSRSPELRKRLEREAQAISSLSHPHICTLHDVGQHLGVDFLVMEYLEGETLAQRLRKGRLPLDQALRHATEIADALDKAHRQGVIHRDLKPGNIMLTKSGAKLLDFGLAKLRGTGAEDEASRASALPTEDRPLTEEGTILGTYPYMSPEQLEGKEADARTDIFAFGSVLYEMFTGKRAFEGKSRASLIAAIMSSEPRPISELQPMTPSAVDHLVKTCLAKDPEERWQNAHDLVAELRWIEEAGSQAGVPTPIAARRRTRARLAWLACGILIGVVLGSAVWSFNSRNIPAVTHVRLGVQPAEQLGGGLRLERMIWVGLQRPSRTDLAFSPDGRRLVFNGGKDGQWQLHVRPLDEPEASPMTGTESGISPFFSPDGEWIGFWADGNLKKVSISGGLPVTLCETRIIFGASWGANDNVVFALEEGGLLEVSADGGTPEELTTLEEGERSHRLPHFLPGGEALLFTVQKSVGGSLRDSAIALQILATGERRVLVESGTDARYVPTGHLLYADWGTLTAAPFDLARLQVTGSAVPVIDGVMQAARSGNFTLDTGAGQFTVSRSGSLAFLDGGLLPDQKNTLVWLDRSGGVESLDAPEAAYLLPRLSPDGQLVAVCVHEFDKENDFRIWLLDISRGTLRPLTHGGAESNATWTPDGRRIAFASFGSRRSSLVWQAADGSGDSEELTSSESMLFPGSWSPDGRELAYVKDRDIWVLPLTEGERQPRPVVQTPFAAAHPAFSPDGRWLAFESNESGRPEVYVQPYPGPGPKTQISVDGGRSPAWSGDGRELFFRDGDKRMAVEVTTEPVLEVGKPVLLFEAKYGTASPNRNYDVTRDGQRFLMVDISKLPPHEPVTHINVVLNWFEELKRRVPVN